MIKELTQEYKRLMLSQQIDPKSLDYNLLRKHIKVFSQSDGQPSLAISIYDNYRMEHAYESEYHKHLFGNGEIEVHPDDMEDVLKSAIATLKHVFQGNKNRTHIKMIREYRAKIGDRFRRVTESFQILETDDKGNIWLALCFLEISPNQQPPFAVNTQIINTATGEVSRLPVSALFEAVGQQPETRVAAALFSLDPAGFLPAGEDCLTSIPGLFAAGDCRTKAVRQLTTACADGATAALAACQFCRELERRT